MIKNISIIFMVLIVSGCAIISDKYRKPNCYENVAIAKISIEEAHNSATILTINKKITVSASQKTYNVLEQSNKIVDNASTLCSLDEVAAYDYMDQAYKLIESASNIMKGIK